MKLKKKESDKIQTKSHKKIIDLMNRNQNDINYQKEFIIKMMTRFRYFMSYKGFIKKNIQNAVFG